MQKITDPQYQWTGPRGSITKESHRFLLTNVGSLDIYNIEASDSGHYTCKVKYIYHGKQLTSEIHFMVYVYHMPWKSIHLSSEFTVGTCETSTVASFEKYLFQKLESLISNLDRELKQWTIQCHTATDTLEKITHKLTLHFVVYPLVLTIADICRSSQCENSTNKMKEAYTKIRQFFEVQKTDSSHRDDLSYVPGTLTGVKVDHCKPGFGKNINDLNNNTTCPGCCVTCPPGQFSAKSNTICTLCPAGSYNGKYGQVECENCPKAQSSDRRGAKTETECHRILPAWTVFSITFTATCLILLTTWVILTKCCKKTIAAQYIREAESEQKRRLKAFANIACDEEIKDQRNKLNPIKVQINKVDFLEEESKGLLSNDEVTEASTPVRNLSPDQTGPSELETSFEDQAPPIWEKESN
uniref:Zona pellucida-binding protein 2-like n=1 Tax=Pogona vitticeps TaxID=103695 RepID=A0ABM5GQS4_9SAUR